MIFLIGLISRVLCEILEKLNFTKKVSKRVYKVALIICPKHQQDRIDEIYSGAEDLPSCESRVCWNIYLIVAAVMYRLYLDKLILVPRSEEKAEPSSNLPQDSSNEKTLPHIDSSQDL